MSKKLYALVILDGYAISEEKRGNAIAAADKPNLDRLFKECPNTLISASGMSVGLPGGQMGNSEVGHTNIGAGRIVYQELTRITKAIDDGDFFENPRLLKAINNCAQNGGALHLLGLVSDGGVHSHNTHLYGLLELAKRHELKKVYVHCFLDGRDCPPTSGAGFLRELEGKLGENASIATVMGRYYAMDRDNRWERVEKAYAAMAEGVGAEAEKASDYVEGSYKNGVTDEFVLPAVIDKSGTIQENDSVICFNFRPDRVREITRAFVDPDFKGFSRRGGMFPLTYICMTEYDATMPGVETAFLPQEIRNTFGEYLAALGMKQLRIAETEKYAHVTFFFNGGLEKPYEGEDRVLIPSPKVATYDLMPEMSAHKVTDEVVKRINSGEYDVIVLNFANCDMVGHSGIFSAAKKAVEVVDFCVGRVYEAISGVGGVLVLTADHGNADQMTDPVDGGAFTAHTTNPVPLLVCGANVKLRRGGCLADIAPTIIDLMGAKQPEEMTGKSLLEK